MNKIVAPKSLNICITIFKTEFVLLLSGTFSYDISQPFLFLEKNWDLFDFPFKSTESGSSEASQFLAVWSLFSQTGQTSQFFTKHRQDNMCSDRIFHQKLSKFYFQRSRRLKVQCDNSKNSRVTIENSMCLKNVYQRQTSKIWCNYQIAHNILTKTR